jgi:DNA-binding NtrC family response regulator
VFVVGPTRRLRYANPAWEALTGRPLANVRGMRVSARKSAAALAQALAVPPDVWAGQVATVRRPHPDADAGPPWWDVTFVPLSGDGKPLAVLGFVAAVGAKPGRGGGYKVPAALADLRKRHAAHFSFDLLAGRSSASERLAAQARLAAATDVPVWVVGEPGAGKETFARVVHHNGAGRERAFVGLDCGGVQPYLVEAVLFGRAGLAGTPHAGTLFLKEPAALPRDLQDRIARSVTPLSPAGPRLVCSSPRPALEDVSAGKLIPLFHTALSVLEVRVPPLRDRADDLARFADRLLDRLPAKAALTDDAVTVLRAYDWPGNLRELAGVLTEAARQAGAAAIGKDHLPRFVREAHLIAANPVPKPGKPWALDAVLEAVEKRLIEEALRQSGNSQTAAADRLGVFRSRLGRRMEALGIAPPPQPPKPRKSE